MERIQTEIAIAARPEDVWDVLIDFNSYPEWNPFIRSASGVPQAGRRLEIRIQPEGDSGMTFRPVVLRADPTRELRWLGKLLVRGLFDGEHAFVLEATGPNRTRLLHSEAFKGLLVPLFARKLRTSTRSGFEKMNQALKHRVESRSGK